MTSRTLPREIRDKVAKTTHLVASQGVRYPSLRTKPVERNQDKRFHFMRVDLDYQMVVVLEGRDVLFDMVGPHDATERRGERATLASYEGRLAIDPETFVRRPALPPGIARGADPVWRTAQPTADRGRSREGCGPDHGRPLWRPRRLPRWADRGLDDLPIPPSAASRRPERRRSRTGDRWARHREDRHWPPSGEEVRRSAQRL